jgi:hypothetical protein
MAEDKDKNLKGEINFEFGQGFKGLNMDNIPSQIDKGSLSYALNAAIENFDANSITYQNEPGTEFCLKFPKDYILIGKYLITEQSKQVFFLANPSTGDSEIGYMVNNDCIYHTLVNDKCLNFDVRYPIHKVVHKTSNCDTEIYWAQPNADRRYINMDPTKIPYLALPDSTPCDEKLTLQLDCNQLRVQPNFDIPGIIVKDVIIGGNIIAGVYQFAFQYSDALGNPLTSYYSITNPTPIADPQFASVNFNYPVGKSIIVGITNIETGGQFEYFNLAVIKTINAITSVDLIGTYNIDSDQKDITYAGQNVSLINLTVNNIFEKFPFYGPADDVTTAQDVLIWKGLSTPERISYQSIANQITLLWETVRIPATENYADELNATHLRGYLRDEVYPFEFVPLLRSGQQVDGFHIPGRALTLSEIALPVIDISNDDFTEDPELYPDGAPYWKIYNTAKVIGNSPGFSTASDYKGPYNYGIMAYWESNETYPCDEEMWGELASQPIRHHKFPDVLVSPIIESKTNPLNLALEMGNDAVFPIGVRVDIEQIKLLIKTSSLTDLQKADIVGFKIVRGDRTDNKSIVAKGILRNVGTYKRDDQEFYYPNYPYNDLHADPFLNSNNNAYNSAAKSWLVICSETGVLQIGDPDTNKPTKRNMIAGTTEEICSTSRPVYLSGKANIGPAEYDVWYVYDHGCHGSRVNWVDPFSDINAANTLRSDWMESIFGISQNQLYCRVAVGGNVEFECDNGGFFDPCECTPVQVFKPYTSQPVDVIDSDGGGENDPHIGRRTLNNCEGNTPLAPISTNDSLRYRQIFNSPETSFGQPFLGDILKAESVIYGGGLAHFVEVKDNAKYRLLTKEAQQDALTSAGEVGNGDAAATFTAYQAYLEIYINGITRKNYAYSFNSIADYNYSTSIPNEQGIKQRRLDLRRYLIPAVQNVGENDIDINNYQRESSVYLRTDLDIDPLPFPHLSPNMIPINIQDISRFTTGCSGSTTCVDTSMTTTTTTTFYVPYCPGSCAEPAKKLPIQVVSYYASLKNTFRGQWGQIYSYQTIDTGFQVNLENEGSATKIVFGGDTFISRFAFKTKVPFFIDNRVGAPQDSEVFYDELGNIGYPKYWHSSRSILEDFNVPVLGNMTNIITYKAHNFDCPNCQTVPAVANPNRTFYDGIFYLFAYGIPNFYVETSYNVDLRQAFNNKEGDFWPHVSNSIPDDWVQESFVTIAQDNTYYYNGSFSKQNTENYFSHIPANFEFDDCTSNYPFRAIFSDPQIATADTTVNNWLTYRASAYFDFPQNYGALTSLDGIDKGQVLARFENKALLYNALYTTQTNTNGQVYLGQSLFTRQPPPYDYVETDLGYLGSQHKFLLKIPQGQITIDAKRGQVFLMNNTKAQDLSAPGSGMNRFFTDHLAFEILRYFPNVNIDNNFNRIGLHGVYDSKFDRVIITKLDYIPLSTDIVFDMDSQSFYKETQAEIGVFKEPISVNNPVYFCNKSWTISYSFITNSWLSFHSYIPNWYIGENNFFYSGKKSCCEPFKFLAGEIIANPLTTTTTTAFPLPPTTTSTTTIALDCTLIGVAQGTSCELEGTGIITIPPPGPPCTRPSGLDPFALYTGYNVIAPPSSVVSTASFSEACNAKSYMLYNLVNVTPTTIIGWTTSLVVGVTVYANNATQDCEVIPDGFYFTPITLDGIYEVVNGVIVSITPCSLTTTTTSSSTTTTTTTAFPVIPCNSLVSSGGVGITEYIVALVSEGGTVAMALNAVSVPDKLEILHNGIKKATSGMTTPNEGPFDNLYGDPTIPTVPETNATDQFIGTSKGTIPNRQATFASETGSGLIIPGSYQQIIWWEYTNADFLINPVAVIRVTGPDTTAWEIQRMCETTTTTTTTP